MEGAKMQKLIRTVTAHIKTHGLLHYEDNLIGHIDFASGKVVW
jgi:hypothetical protein